MATKKTFVPATCIGVQEKLYREYEQGSGRFGDDKGPWMGLFRQTSPLYGVRDQAVVLQSSRRS